MKYKTTKAIRDLQDNEHYYYEGAIYPREGLEVSQERLDELIEKGVIIAIEEKPAALKKKAKTKTKTDAKED